MLPMRPPVSITCLLDHFLFALLRGDLLRPRRPGRGHLLCLPVARGVRHPLAVPTIAELLEVQPAWAAAGA
jgi:hypothetical protein